MNLPPEVWTLLGAVVSTGLIVRLIDRWRYRRKPQMDLVKLAQDIAERALMQARAELEESYATENSLRQEVSQLRQELAQARQEMAQGRIEIQRLTALVQARESMA